MDEFSTTDFEDTEPGGSTFVPASTYTDTMSQAEYDAYNSPAGNTSNNYVQPGAYTMDANGVKTPVSDLSGLSKFLSENKGLALAGGALAGLMGAGDSKYGKTGYQGTIPRLGASRTMVTAPPTRAQGYRPGAGGIDYGGDVTYTRLPAGVDSWAGLSGTTGTSAGANLGGLGSLAGTKLPSDVAAAVTNLLSGNKTSTVTGGTGKDTLVGGVGKDTLVGGTGTDTIVKQPANVGSAGYQWATQRLGMTPQQYLSSINQWILDNPRATKQQIIDAMGAAGVTATDLQTALGASNFSNATKYALTHGMSLQDMNQNIEQWLRDHPYATNDEIQAAMNAKNVQINDEDIARAMNGLNSSAAKEYAVVHDMGLDKLYKNILDYQAAGHTPEEIAAAMAATGVEQRDINAAAKYAADTGYKANATSAAATQNFLPPTNLGSIADKVADIIGGKNKDTQASAPTGLDTSNDIYKYFADPATQAALASGNTRSIAETMQSLGWSPAEVAAATGTNAADVQAQYEAALAGMNDRYAAGGEIAMAKGRYLQGETDGMADELPAKIGESQPAALSHGEFVIPADVVSHMGNGNSDAGAKKLYQMMDKIRMARTGTKKQGKKINPDKFMPGGLANSKYAKGGTVKHFLTGGATGTSGVGTAANAGVTGVESNLSNWAGDYVTNMLGQGQALANMPYTAYKGPLTAGESPLQTGAFQTAAGLTTPASIGTAASTAGDIATKAQGLSYSPTTTTFDATQAKAYMNPYLQASLDPQIAEARRQSQITQQQNAAKMTQAGAFGGSRQAILDAETQRALGANLANITGAGYNTAYDKAMAQFNADQARKAQEAQFGATYGLQGLQTGLQGAQTQGQLGATEAQTGLANLKTQLDAGQIQRGIESEGIAADKAAFEEARANPYKMVQFQQSLLQGLPLAAQSYNLTQPSTLSNIGSGVATANDLLNVLLGNTAAKKV